VKPSGEAWEETKFGNRIFSGLCARFYDMRYNDFRDMAARFPDEVTSLADTSEK
jgi:anthranilate/para-aminobenzoate synthase component II